MTVDDQTAFDHCTQSLLDHLEAEANRLNLDVPSMILSVVSLAMHLSVDRRGGNVDHGEQDVIVLAEMVGGQMREWPLEDRLLDAEAIN